MKAIVLGGCGFIGSHIVDALLEAGHQVRVVDLRPERFRDPLPGVEYVLSDFNNDEAFVRLFDGVDVVVHCASSTIPDSSNRDPCADIQGNLLSFVRLLELLRQRDNIKVLFLSSGGTVYGNPAEIPILEEHPLHPICSYGVVKSTMESYLFMYHKLYGLKYVVLRPSNPYGIRQAWGIQGVVASFMSAILDGKPITVWGNGDITRDFFDVRDLAKLSLAAVESDAVGIYNAGSGKGTSILEVVNKISNVTGINPEVIFCDRRSFDVKEVVLDISRAKRDFSWTPQISFEQGLRNFYQWMKTVKALEART